MDTTEDPVSTAPARRIRKRVPAEPKARTTADAFHVGDHVRTFIGKAAIEAEVVDFKPPRPRENARILPGLVKPCGCPVLETEHPGEVTMRTFVNGKEMTRTTGSVELITAAEARGE